MKVVTRGGIPTVRRLTINQTGELFTSPMTMRVQISNEGANPLRIYFKLDDFTADAGYIELAATTGFYDAAIGVENIWLRAFGGVTTPVVLHRILSP